MTDQQIKRLRELAEGATPGPWETGCRPDGHCRIYAPTENHAIARTYGPEINGIGVCALTGPKNVADAAFIAASREAVPELIELADRQAARITALEDETARSVSNNCTAPASIRQLELSNAVRDVLAERWSRAEKHQQFDVNDARLELDSDWLDPERLLREARSEREILVRSCAFMLHLLEEHDAEARRVSDDATGVKGETES